MTRSKAVQDLARMIAEINPGRPARIGIDGNSCSGKTRLADELVEPVGAHGRPVIRASIDGFHHPAEFRRRRGPDCPRGYYEDSFDLEAVRQCILLPLGPNGNRSYQASRFDFRNEATAESTWKTAEPDAVLIFEGVFLHRPELTPHWDFTIYVEASAEITLQRALVRDREHFGSAAKVRHKYENRYIPGQEIYKESCDPANSANALFLNDDIERPTLQIRRPSNGKI